MPSSVSKPPSVKLSICITTFNRAAFIGATLDSILSRLPNDCEVVVLDGGSTDDTEGVMSSYVERFNCVRYVKSGTNRGFDNDCDRVVGLAMGEYCWLMTDDDLLNPGAVAAVRREIRSDLSLIVVNVETYDFNMSKRFQSRWIDIDSNRLYGPEENDRLFMELGDVLNYVGCIVINRTIWLSRVREKYYGSLFVYLGVIFQEPLPGRTLVLAEPLIRYRRSNTHTWSQGEAVFCKWPLLVKSLAISESAKSRVHSVEPWKHLEELLLWRALGVYSWTEYRRWIYPQLSSKRQAVKPVVFACIPGVLAIAIFVLYCSLTTRGCRGVRPEVWLLILRESRFYFRNWHVWRRLVRNED